MDEPGDRGEADEGQRPELQRRETTGGERPEQDRERGGAAGHRFSSSFVMPDLFRHPSRRKSKRAALCGTVDGGTSPA
jgi:hypothetical protein